MDSTPEVSSAPCSNREQDGNEPATLANLAKRCEYADGPDRELDAAIAIAVFGFYVAEPRYEGEPTRYGYVDPDGSRVEPGQAGDMLVRRFTGSLDAALELAPGRDWEWSLEWETDSDGQMFARCAMGDPARFSDCEAKTLPLAFCAASLRARSAA